MKIRLLDIFFHIFFYYIFKSIHYFSNFVRKTGVHRKERGGTRNQEVNLMDKSLAYQLANQKCRSLLDKTIQVTIYSSVEYPHLISSIYR